jgi:hypothetical protein
MPARARRRVQRLTDAYENSGPVVQVVRLQPKVTLT